MKRILKPRSDDAQTGIQLIPIDGDDTWKEFLPTSASDFPKTLCRYRGDNEKYVRDEIWKAGKENKIYTSAFPSFFDPREFRPLITEATQSDYCSVIDLCFKMDPDWVFPDIEMRELAQYLERPYLSVRRKLHRDYSAHINVLRKYAHDLIETVRKEKRCACFSKGFGSSLMWEYYASKGRGVCLVFELDQIAIDSQVKLGRPESVYRIQNGTYEEIPFRKPNEWQYTWEIIQYLNRIAVGDVIYSDTVPLVRDLDINISAIRHPEKGFKKCVEMIGDKDRVVKMLFTKDSQYSRESEWRLINNSSSEYADLPIYRLDRVVFGFASVSSLQIAISELCKSIGVKTTIAVPSQNGFGFTETPFVTNP